MKLNVRRADPAGNITLFVLDPIPSGDRAGLAARLMALPGTDVEQVGYLCPPVMGGAGRMEMAGGEFCGNATRAFGLMVSQKLGSPSRVLVEVSGCDRPVTVELSDGAARAQMPLPRSVRSVEAGGHSGALVDLGGIAHLVVEDVPPSQAFFQTAEPLLEAFPEADAYGVIFLDSRAGTMTPLVKVPAAGTLVWEGSCGSGSLAAAAAQSQNAPDGPFVRTYVQPAGKIEATVTRKNGKIVSAWIGGPVTLDPPCQIEI